MRTLGPSAAISYKDKGWVIANVTGAVLDFLAVDGKHGGQPADGVVIEALGKKYCPAFPVPADREPDALPLVPRWGRRRRRAPKRAAAGSPTRTSDATTWKRKSTEEAADIHLKQLQI